MSFDRITFQSYCWSLGTTSFRTKNFNRTIEEQLALLDQFWSKPENKNRQWTSNNELQCEYYYFLQGCGFLEGEAERPDKDAREKTSGLVDIGLINSNRRLTEVGRALLELSRSGNFESDNILQIAADSYIYMKQLLKTHCNIGNNVVRPFIVLLRFLLDKQLGGYITDEEFTYILPLCVSNSITQEALQNIRRIRTGELSIDDVIMRILSSMANYSNAHSLLINNHVSRELICTIGMNRKSARYDLPYYDVFEDLYRFYVVKDLSVIGSLLNHINRLKLKVAWRKYLFNTSNTYAIKSDPLGCSTVNAFTSCTTLEDFKEAFFKTMHLLKAKATLYDYHDLNKRYLSTADIILFEDGKVCLDVIPKQFFASCIDELYKFAFIGSPLLGSDCELTEISHSLQVSKEAIINGLNKEYKLEIASMDEAVMLVENQRYERFNRLVDTRFTDEKLIQMLDLLDRRDDDSLMRMVTENADAPTIFEYVLGIIWYKISNRQGKILDYLNLSLDADLLPKSHAAGGDADIVYEYKESDSYPQHTLLLEATLADRTNQRRMEMEPVSRHLGNHLIATQNTNSYCVFVTNNLNPNVISDFRQRKDSVYYGADVSRYITGMKIIPLETEDLRSIIKLHKRYPELYDKFEIAFKEERITNPYDWWLCCIRNSVIQ